MLPPMPLPCGCRLRERFLPCVVHRGVRSRSMLVRRCAGLPDPQWVDEPAPSRERAIWEYQHPQVAGRTQWTDRVVPRHTDAAWVETHRFQLRRGWLRTQPYSTPRVQEEW